MRKLKNAREETPAVGVDERKYGAAWAVVQEIDNLTEALGAENDPKERSKIQREIRGLENKITPTAKRVAADRNRPLVKAMLRYIRANGAPSNIADLLDWLRDEGFVIAPDNAPKPANGVTARTVRNVLHDTFGIEGQMGRKPKVL